MKYFKILIIYFLFFGIFMAGFNTMFDHHDGKPFDTGIFIIRFLTYGLSLSAIQVVIQIYTDSKASRK